jgi:transposase
MRDFYREREFSRSLFSTLLLIIHLMATPRRPLGLIDANISDRKELSPYIRGQVIAAKRFGHKPAEIATVLNLPDSTVRTTIIRESQRLNGKSKKGRGRRKSYTPRDERNLLRHIRLNPKDTYAAVRQATGLEISRTTIKKILKASGITNWRAKKRPALTEKHAQKRLAWCKARKDWTRDNWKNIMWSDECSAERGKGKCGVWVFRTPAQKWDKEMIETYAKSKDISVMVWGCFWGLEEGIGRSELYLLDRDFEAKKYGYSARSYLEVLEDQMPKCWEPGLIFMQDGASIHTAYAVRRWFQDMAIPLIDWPAVSPDLNPIEHVWWHLKKGVLEAHPELENIGATEEAIQALGRALVEVWGTLPDSLFESLIESMPRRVAACIAADGWHTKY